MLIEMNEPVTPRYIYITPGTNIVHLMVPVVGGQEVGTDNTCEATKAYKSFFKDKEAPAELRRYKDALEWDIKLLPKGDYIRAQKANRLKQIIDYINAISRIRECHKEPALRTFFKNPSNLYTILLRPKYKDNYLFRKQSVFTIARGDDSNGTPLSALYNALHTTFSAIFIYDQNDPRTVLSRAVLNSLPSWPSFENIQEALKRQFSFLFGLDIDFTKDGSAESVTKKSVDELMMIDEDDAVEPDEYITHLINVCCPDIWGTIPSYPFYSMAPGIRASVKEERLSIMTQFFLGIFNVYCKSRELSNEDFGRVLDSSHVLSKALVQNIYLALTSGEDVEKTIFDYINGSPDIFKLSRLLNEEDLTFIRKKFTRTYSTISDSPHMDDFLILDREATGDIAKAVTHQGSICVDFTELFGTRFLEEDVIKKIRDDFIAHPIDIPHRNECINTKKVDVDIDSLLDTLSDAELSIPRCVVC